MDESNIMDSRTRGAAKPKGTYTEPGDEEVSYSVFMYSAAVLIHAQGLPGPEDGTSSTA